MLTFKFGAKVRPFSRPRNPDGVVFIYPKKGISPFVHPLSCLLRRRATRHTAFQLLPQPLSPCFRSLKIGLTHTYGIGESLTCTIGETLTPFEVVEGPFDWLWKKALPDLSARIKQIGLFLRAFFSL